MKKDFFFIACFAITCALLSCAPKKKDAKVIIAEAKKASFVILTFDEYGSPMGTGSGFFIDSNGTGITSYHVLDKATKACISLDNDSLYEINKVISSDKKWDIVKFTINNKTNEKFDFLSFSTKPVEQGDIVYNVSTPMGLEQTASSGMVSSIRTDSHGEVIQITAPISQGSSGSAILNEYGEVIAVATFLRNGGQNLNFGVSINEERLEALTENPFDKNNKAFNRKDDFVILNIPDDRDGDVVLNALEFKKDATIAYFSFTNLNLSYTNFVIWCELNKQDEGFLIHDKERDKKYYLTSSTIGVNKKKGTEIPLASSYKFKVFFPAIKETPAYSSFCRVILHTFSQ